MFILEFSVIHKKYVSQPKCPEWPCGCVAVPMRQADSKVDSMRGNSTNASYRGEQLAQMKTDYEEALQTLFTTDISASTDQYVPIPWYGPPASNASQTLKADVKSLFDIHSEETRCKLAIECRVAQLAIDKGVKSSRDGTL